MGPTSECTTSWQVWHTRCAHPQPSVSLPSSLQLFACHQPCGPRSAMQLHCPRPARQEDPSTRCQGTAELAPMEDLDSLGHLLVSGPIVAAWYPNPQDATPQREAPQHTAVSPWHRSCGTLLPAPDPKCVANAPNLQSVYHHAVDPVTATPCWRRVGPSQPSAAILVAYLHPSSGVASGCDRVPPGCECTRIMQSQARLSSQQPGLAICYTALLPHPTAVAMWSGARANECPREPPGPRPPPAGPYQPLLPARSSARSRAGVHSPPQVCAAAFYHLPGPPPRPVSSAAASLQLQ
mmetsp:Transcript_43629/g.102895  ORF Transcript_43629/g.102895 Transcript_43629/m.102895 type:complete len:294 (-) Transcript_43629:885-1766(-)